MKIAPVIATVTITLACGSSPSEGRKAALQAALTDAEISLLDAIAAASATDPSAEVTGAELEVEEGTPVYEVELVTASGEVEVRIDPVSGEVIESIPDTDTDDPDDDDAPCTGTVASFDVAIAAAEAEVSGQAVSVEREDCTVEVEVITADALYEVQIASDGSVASVEQEDDDEDDNDATDDDDADDDD